MQPTHFFKAFILMLATVIGFVACWEYYWRSIMNLSRALNVAFCQRK